MYQDAFEFDDLHDDLDEKKNRMETSGKIAADMKEELMDLLITANKGFENNTNSKE